MDDDRVLILGGGMAGLAAAHRLAERGVGSTILEAADRTGGLAGSTDIDGAPVETFYHHIKPEDGHVIHLIEKMGLGHELLWSDTRMGFYIDEKFHRFSTPLDLIRFSPLSLVDRVRFGLGVLKAKRVEGKSLEGLNAEEWVIRDWSRNIYERMMRPMLLNKFGIPPARISAGFLQGRIKGLSSAKSDVKGGEKFAYLRGSLVTLTDRIEEEIRPFCDLRLNAPVEGIESTPDGFNVRSGDQYFSGRHVINTLPLTVFADIPKNVPFETTVEYQAVVCGLFSIEEELTSLYWINVLDPDIAFRVLVNQSRLESYSHTIIHCANYLKQDDPLFEKSDEEILNLYVESLEKMFDKVTVIEGKVFRSAHATPVFDKDFASRTSDLDECIPGMTFAGNVKVYPYSRTVGSVIGTAYAAAESALRSSKSKR